MMPARILRVTRSSVANTSNNGISESSHHSSYASLNDLANVANMASVVDASNVTATEQLPAKRSLTDLSSAADEQDVVQVAAPVSPGSTKGHQVADEVPSSPSQNTRAARASARAAKQQEKEHNSASHASPSPRSCKRTKLSHSQDTSVFTDGTGRNGNAPAAPAPAEGTDADTDVHKSSHVDQGDVRGEQENGGTKDTEIVGGAHVKDQASSLLLSTRDGVNASFGNEGEESSPSITNGSNSRTTKTNLATVTEVAPTTTHAAAAAASPPPPSISSAPPTPPPPLKSLTMAHLRKKYLQELEYMRVEFRKLEKQLLGARASAATESAASRERREKLHSFIVHLEDTIKQIKEGCELERHRAESGDEPSRAATSIMEDYEKKREFADSAALTKLTREKEEEETVQKLEEHILANLLPVKVRLTKQLAAQQGASRNPAGMPTSARGPRPSAAAIGKGTFAAAAEERRKREESARLAAKQSQEEGESSSTLSPPPTTSLLGKPLGGGGSSLTARLHGSTLGSKSRPAGHGVGQSQEPSSAAVLKKTSTDGSLDSNDGQQPKRKVLYAGMALGSEQVSSSVSAAQGAHKMVVTDPALRAAHQAGLAAAAIEEGAGALASLASARPPPPPPPPLGVRGARPKGVVRPQHAGARPDLVTTSGSESSSDAINATTARGRADRPGAGLRATSPGPASAAVAKVQVQQVATAAQLVARAKARAAAGLPPLDTPVTSAAAAELRRTGKKSTANRGKRRRLTEKDLTDEERGRITRRRDRRQKRRRKAKRLERERVRHAAYAAQTRHYHAQQSAAAAAAVVPVVAQSKPEPAKRGGKGKFGGGCVSSKKQGPRTVEYVCGLCNEAYMSTCDVNPWWALRQQDCAKCGKRQVPRIDISAPANAIEYHPALLAHAEDSSSSSGGGRGSVSLVAKGPVPGTYLPSGPVHLAVPPKFPDLGDLYDSASEPSDDDEAVSLGGESSEESDDDDTILGFNGHLSPSERAEAEDFGKDYAGPCLKDDESARLLLLMGHASTCPGRHRTGKLRDICHSTKFMMMHVRDCPGTTSTFDVCPFPWCRKVKHLLYHLVSCQKTEECLICSPKDIPPSLKALRGLNAHRHKKQREKMRAAAAAAASARSAAVKARVPAPSYSHLKKPVAGTKPPATKTPPTKYVPPATTGPIRRLGEAVPNPTLGQAGSKHPSSSKYAPSAKLNPQTRHHGASFPAKKVAPSAMPAPFASKSTGPLKSVSAVTTRHPGAHPGATAIGKEVPTPLRGSTPNPILPHDTTTRKVAPALTPTPNPLAPVKAKVAHVPPTRPVQKTGPTNTVPVPPTARCTQESTAATSNGEKTKVANNDSVTASAVSRFEKSGGGNYEQASHSSSREATPPGCSGQATATKSAESVRVIED